MNAKDVILARRMGGGGSVPKPLTYDYMPEGYPTKSVQTTVLMEEQEVVFTENGGKYVAALASGLSLVEGQTYTVNWDGTEYECVSRKFNNILIIGNLSIFGLSENSGEPFLYVMSGKAFTTLDTSSSHTISVKTSSEVATPMVEEFLPAIPADKLPAIPADKLPAIPADKLEFPIIKISGNIRSTIADSTQPSYDVTNLDNSGIVAAINSGIFAVQDDENLYFPTSADVSANNDAFINIVFKSVSRIYFAELCCNAGLTNFFRNSCYYIDAIQLG